MRYLGLTSKEAEDKISRFGFNEISEKKKSTLKKFLRFLISPIALMLLVAAFLSLSIGKIFDFSFIIVLMLINFFVGFWQEKKADNAIAQLKEKLSVEVTVLRDGHWQRIHSKELVPGDIIELNLGDIIPADIKIIEQKNLSLNEASLTGESLPKEKKINELCYSGSFVESGWGHAQVEKTGKNTYFGKILISVDTNRRRSILEKDILNISKMLSVTSILVVIILSAIFIFQGKPLIELLTLDLSLIIAGIPISLPTIMTLIISFGVLELTKKKIVVRRLSALEDLANVNLLLSDKTGTLTQNKISVEKIIAYGDFDKNKIIRLAIATTRENDRNSINQAIIKKFKSLDLKKENLKVIDFIPFDSNRKRSTAIIKNSSGNLTIAAGAAQIIETFCDLSRKESQLFNKDVEMAAQKGYRVVAIASKKGMGEKNMTLNGLLFFSDTLEPDAKQTIKFISDSGIGIKMLTGDNKAIAERVANTLSLKGKVVTKKSLGKNFSDLSKEEFDKIGVFAEILPSDKSDLVKLAHENYTVAVTGDGVNDLPALKTADIGIAVKNAVDALKSAADLTLFTNGIFVIKNALIESRKIFARLYTYSIYRISESFRVIVTIALLGIIYNTYPLSPLQLILLALLNDIPIISLAFNRVKIARKPSSIKAKARLKLSLLFGTVGTINSFIFFIITNNILHLSWETIQTLFFLKLTVSGHMLIYVAHTKERWWKFLPSKEVIIATTATQLLGTIFALLGIFMSQVSWQWIFFVWIWAFSWSQVSELMKKFK